MKTRIRFGFKGKNQLSLFMLWKEYYNDNGDIYYARVLFEIKGRKMRKALKELQNER